MQTKVILHTMPGWAATYISISPRNLQSLEHDGATRDLDDLSHIFAVEDHLPRILGSDRDVRADQ